MGSRVPRVQAAASGNLFMSDDRQFGGSEISQRTGTSKHQPRPRNWISPPISMASLSFTSISNALRGPLGHSRESLFEGFELRFDHSRSDLRSAIRWFASTRLVATFPHVLSTPREVAMSYDYESRVQITISALRFENLSRETRNRSWLLTGFSPDAGGNIAALCWQLKNMIQWTRQFSHPDPPNPTGPKQRRNRR
jgi:hypothetical protein